MTNSNNSKLPNIIENRVIELILEYLLSGNTSETIYVFLINKFIRRKNQIVKLSLVSKRWFNRISDTISTNIKQSIKSVQVRMNKLWYDSNFILTNNKKKINNNGKWSLIKVEGSYGLDDLFAKGEYKYTPETVDYSNKQYTIICSSSKIASKGINGIGKINDIDTFRYLFNHPNISLIGYFYFGLLLNSPFALKLGNSSSTLLFETLSIVDMHLFYSYLFEMGLLKVKELSLQSTDQYDSEHDTFKQLLSKICCDSNDQLKSIEIRKGKFDIGSIIHTNKMKNLESLSFPLDCEQLYSILCLPSKVYDYSIINQTKSNWGTMVQSLSTNQYLKVL